MTSRSFIVMFLFTSIMMVTIKSQLYGTTSDGKLVTVKFDKPMNDPVADFLQAPGQSALDSENGVYYVMIGDASKWTFSVVGLSIPSGKQVSNTPVPGFMFSIAADNHIDYDPKTKRVIVFAHEAKQRLCPFVLAIDPSKSVVTQLAAGEDSICGATQVDAPGAYDYVNKVSHFLAMDPNQKGVLTGLSTKTNKTVYQTPNSPNVLSMSFDSKTGLVYCLGMDVNANMTLSLSTIDHKGKLTKIKNFPSDVGSLPFGSLGYLDSSTRLYYSILNSRKSGEQLVSINVDTGDIGQKTDNFCDAKVHACPSNLAFYHKSQ